MKKIFLVTGLLSFGFAKAQQPELFDIDKHLLDKSKQKSITHLSPQFLFNFSTPGADTAMFSHLTPNGDRVYVLQQDKMPCVVPGTEQRIMPNVPFDRLNIQGYIRRGYGSIPNAVIPHAIILDKK